MNKYEQLENKIAEPKKKVERSKNEDNIDLSRYSGTIREVKVTFKDNNLFTGKLFLYEKENDTYLFTSKIRNTINTRNGNSVFNSSDDIVKIELVNDENPNQMSLNSLEPETLNTIASALTIEAINYIESHEKYAEVMQFLINEFVEKNLGVLNGELPFMIFDRIFLYRKRSITQLR